MTDRSFSEFRYGTIVSSNDYGMYVIVEPSTKHEYVFTLDKVQAYDGGDPNRMGLSPGKRVQFSEQHGKVILVRPSA